jgi:TRAP-type C4-dicarboxylate transport system substrate-binding protein
MKIALAAFVFASTALAFGQVQAEPIQLRYAFAGSQQSNIHQHATGPWAEKVSRESDGTIEIKIFPGQALGPIQVMYDRTVNGVVDFAFITIGPVVTNFPKSTVFTIPYEVETNLEGSLAMWRLYERGIIADEFAQVKPVAMLTFAGLSFHSKKPIRTLEDIKGMKMGANSRMMAQGIDKLGGTVVTMATPEFYQALQRGTVEAVHTGWPAVNGFKIAEVVKAHLREPLGGEVAFNGMNKDVYAKLPQKAKQAIDRNAGASYSEMMGKAVTRDDEAGPIMAQARGNEIVKLAPEETARWKARMKPLIDEWVAATPNGAAVLAAAREEIAKIRAGR